LAASRFQAIPSPRAIPALAQATQDADDLLRIAAVTALQNTATPEAIEPLIAALSDGNTNVRNLALAALSGRNDPRAQAAANAFKARTGMGR
jgi:HEAT repeat protein